MDNYLNLQSNTMANDDFLRKPFIDIPDIAIADLGFFHTPYSVGLIGLNDVQDVESYMAKFKFLSPAVEKLMFDYTTAEFIDSKLGNSFGLTIDQKLEAARIIRDLFLGDIFIGDLTTVVKTKMTVDDAKTQDIISMLVAELFPPALESLKRVQRVNFPSKIQELRTGTTDKKPGEVISRPQQETLNQPLAKPIEPRNIPTPAQQLTQKPVSVRPPVSMPPKPAPPAIATPSLNGIRQAPIQPPPTSPPASTTKPQFSVPNLGDSPIKEQPMPPKPTPNRGLPDLDAQKKLEEDLERVAGVIDLRSKKEE